jgi:general secretion pathway protein G
MFFMTCLRKKCLESRRGFTLIELLIVIAIVGILSSIGLAMYQSYREKLKINVCMLGVKAIQTAITAYFIQREEHPSTLAEAGIGDMIDPWGHPYQYLKIAGLDKKGKGSMRKDRFMVPINTDYDLYSMGPDGKSASALTAKISQDDIIRANDGQYIGLASGY